MINYEGAAGVKVISDAASSTLIIERAQSVHSGNYSCVPYNVNPSSVIVHILNGKKLLLLLLLLLTLHIGHTSTLLSDGSTPIRRRVPFFQLVSLPLNTSSLEYAFQSDVPLTATHVERKSKDVV